MLSTQQVWSVTEFIENLETTNNVTKVTAASAMIDDNNAVLISVFEQGIDFAKKSLNVLINPNKCRSFGVQCVVDLAEPTSKLVSNSNYVFLPLCMQGNNCLEESLCPYDIELQQFPWIFMSVEARWDPSNLIWPTISTMSQKMKEEYDTVGSRSDHIVSISN